MLDDRVYYREWTLRAQGERLGVSSQPKAEKERASAPRVLPSTGSVSQLNLPASALDGPRLFAFTVRTWPCSHLITDARLSRRR